MRWMLAVLCLLSLPCYAGEEEAVAALKTSGVTVGKINSGGYLVRVDRTDVSTERFARVKELPSVREVSIGGDRVDEQLAIVADLGTVTHLIVTGDAIGDMSMKAVGKMKSLKSLTVSSNRLTDAGLAHLHGLTELRSASFNSKRVTQAGREKLNDALPKCVVN